MTRAFREPGTVEHPARDWDVVSLGGWIKICFRDAAGQDRYSSDILDEQGFPVRDLASFGTVGDGTRFRVSSGKTYVLTGERRPHPEHPRLSLLWRPEPEPSLMARIFGRRL